MCVDGSGGAMQLAPIPAKKELLEDTQRLQMASNGCALAHLGSIFISKRPFVRGATQQVP